MKDEILSLFRQNLPYIVRDDETVLQIIRHPGNHIIEKRDAQGKLTAVSVINGNTILLLCVDAPHRRKGIGTALLAESEAYIRCSGYDRVTLGVGFDYLMPGVPTSRRYFPAVNERLDPRLDDSASRFFENRGYRHCRDHNVFDMRFSLREFRENTAVNGAITYRWAVPDDRENIFRCTDDAFPEFTQWYRDEQLYLPENNERVLIAISGEEVVGTLIVSAGSEPGTVGCTAVHPGHRGKHIAVDLVTLGTKHLRDAGCQEAYLSYTYSGLDKMYGHAGYRISIYYMMAEKYFDQEENHVSCK